MSAARYIMTLSWYVPIQDLFSASFLEVYMQQNWLSSMSSCKASTECTADSNVAFQQRAVALFVKVFHIKTAEARACCGSEVGMKDAK